MKHAPGAIAGFVAGVGVAVLAIVLIHGPPGKDARPSARPATGSSRDDARSIPSETGGGLEPGGPTDRPAAGGTGKDPGEDAGPDSLGTDTAWEGAACLKGRVVFGLGGPPVPRAFFLVSKDGKLHQEGFTGEGGRFFLGLPEGGPWVVTLIPFDDDGFLVKKTVAVEDGATETVEIVVPDRGIYTITGRVTDEDDNPVKDVKVSVRGKRGARVDSGGAVTDGDGHYALEDLEVRFPLPSAARAQSLEEMAAWGGVTRGPVHSALPCLHLDFDHPAFRRETERADFSSPGGPITCDAVLQKAGRVSGTVECPAGES
ncbi:MAG: carboxypeptidase-like regulatory domain-containing protein, partial [Planctomycetota bacterium]